MIKRIFEFIKKKKILTSVAVLVLVGGTFVAYRSLKSDTLETRYVLAQVTKGTLITSVSGSGQVSASNQLDIKTKVSGEVLDVLVQNGQEVKAGDVLAQLDAKDAYKTVRDAQLSLENAQLSLDKLKQAADDYSILQSENSLASSQNSLEKLKVSQQTDLQQAQQSKQKAEDNITKAYEDAYNSVANTFLELPAIMTEMDDIVYGNGISDKENTGGSSDNINALLNSVPSQQRINFEPFAMAAKSDYDQARSLYNEDLSDYKTTSRYAENDAINTLLDQTLTTVKAIAQAAKSESNYLDAWADYRSKNNFTVFATVTAYQNDLSDIINKVNSNYSSLLSVQNSLQDNSNSLDNATQSLATMKQNQPLDLAAAEASLEEKQMSLDNLKAGPDALDLRAQELSLQQRQYALADAQEKIANYTVRAPFDGIIINLNAKKGDDASSGTALATLMTQQKIAEITLNEIDVAKVKVGQKATLTFDAIEDLNITGTVTDVDMIGTVSQGVVTYGITITFDTQDERVKPGMSVSAAIITDAKQDVLLVPNSAIKSMGQTDYVEMPDETVDANSATSNNGITLKNPLKQQQIQTGAANDSETEITDGLNENDWIIVRTISNSTTSTSSAPTGQNLLQMGGSGGSLRMQTGGFGR